jgi:tetratricopeptide (TPR) repeat protein
MQGGETPSFGDFVGRKREQAELRAALADLNNSRGRLFLMSGEPGIGKTRLAEEIAKEATARGMRTVWGRCWEGDGAPAYWPWIQVIRALVASTDATTRRTIIESEQAYSTIEAVAQIVPELHRGAGARKLAPLPPMDPEQARFRLFDAVATLLKSFAAAGPVAIILDDLHDADISSLLMLRLVARELDRIAMLIVGTYRDIEVQRSPELARRIGDLSREARSLPLAGLSEAEVGQFYRAVAGQAPAVELATRIHSATAGNPLFVDGIVRGLVAESEDGRAVTSSEHFQTPFSLREAIRRRLAILSAPTQSLLNIAAVIGNDFATEICRKAAAVSRAEANSMLDEASAAGILIALQNDRFRFAHALIRSALYEALDTNRRIDLHREVGEAIEQLHAPDVSAHLDELTHHFRAAGLTEKAIEYSYRAARAAYAVYAYALAAEHWRSVEKMTTGHRDMRRADMLFGLGQLEAFQLDPAAGIAHLEQALELYRELQIDERLARINVTLGLAQVFLADFAPQMNIARSLEYFRKGQEWQGEWTDPLALGWLHRGLSAARRATELWRAASSPMWIHAGAFVAQLLSIKGRHRESAARRQEVMQALQEIRDPTLLHVAVFSAGWTNMTMLNLAEARRLFTIAVEREGMPPNLRASALEFLAMTEITSGNSARAKEIAAAHRLNPHFRAAIAVFDGDFEEAAELQRTMIEWGRRTGHLWDVATSLLGLAAALRLSGHPSHALEVLDEATRLYDPTDSWLEIGVRPQAATLEIEAGRLDRAEVHLQVCRQILAQGEDWLGRVGSIERAEGRLAAAQRRPFAPYFEKALALSKKYSLSLEEADTLNSWGSALLSTGHRSEAEAKFDAAIEIYRRCGAGQRWIDRVESHRQAPYSQVAAVSSNENDAVYRREGDLWTITHHGKTFRLRNLKGLAYIAHLLRHPGERLHVFDLVEAIEGSGDRRSIDSGAGAGLKVRRGLGDAGDAIDPRAREEYRRRREELRAELEAAQQQNDPGRADTARHELELLTAELNAAVGRGGRVRKNRAHGERARSLVTKHIRTGLDLIRRHDPELGNHLERSIRTGAFCAYLPDLESKPCWQL